MLTLCGADAFETTFALEAPKTAREVIFDDMVTLLLKYVDTRLSENYIWYVFQRRDQQPEDSISS
ncbi:hypothetical protein HPB48_018530 [Haemaphysalis longicornis]|uniref:Uncharacterized protein n=1 Tax=Haemaphysalis longicornis TaxID=44386 RepID=A0A9J6FSH3_HAELO|nr:hypothetical protein HPB48_018530 [Haemaphysalis longicornis]